MSILSNAATHLMMAFKKGMSALEIGRLLSLSKKTAWFLCHRIRESLRETKPEGPLGGQNMVVEADETYIGKETNKHKSKRREGMQDGKSKEAVVALSGLHSADTAQSITRLRNTSAAASGTTNTVESYFAILKRGIYGTFHHVSQQLLKRYLAEFDFRYNEREALGVGDFERMTKSVQGIVGKRLTYRRPNRAAQAS